MRAGEGQWAEVMPGVQVKLLRNDGQTQSMLARLGPGARVPVHSHSIDEECLVLEGEVFLNDNLLRHGDYQCALAGSRHYETYSDVGALMFVRNAVDTVYGV